MRYYICRAIGEFHVDDGLPALLLAATTRRSPDEIDAQLGALEGIALLSSTMIAREPAWAESHPDVTKTLLELAEDAEDRVRSNAAYALGILGNEEAIDALTRLVDDPYPNVPRQRGDHARPAWQRRGGRNAGRDARPGRNGRH